MSSFAIELEISPNITKANAVSSKVILPPCKIDEIYLEFPNGCAGLVYIWFEYQANKILPVNREDEYRTNDYVIIIKPKWLVVEEDYTLIMKGYNLDDTYAHTPKAWINVTIIEDMITKEVADYFAELYPVGLLPRGV